MQSEGSVRFQNFLESLGIIAILLAIYWTAGLIILKIFNKEIRTDKGYGACVLGGFILKYALISLFKN